MATNDQGNKQSDDEGAGQGKGGSNRGFASMDPERQRQIASEGGKAAHEKGTAHEFTSEEARRAGSMSHGNRQADQTATRSGGGTDSGNKGASKDDDGNRQSQQKQEGSKQQGGESDSKREGGSQSNRQGGRQSTSDDMDE